MSSNISNYIPSLFSQFIYMSRYSRWLPEEGRRETWTETVSRYINYMEKSLKEKHKYKMPPALKDELEQAILSLEVMPSMRALMCAGPALDRCNVAAYNCSYIPIDSPRAFDEILYILMQGTGVGFSVEDTNVDKLPVVNEHFEKSSTTIVVDDSKSGWARAFRELVAMLYAGQIPSIDYSLIRPAGARLKTFGGRASGPEPLKALFDFTIEKFTHAKGRKLSAIECHDIVCKTGEVVVVGGVRRSALISLSDLSDPQMRDCKSGMWWERQSQRALANNSAVYHKKPTITEFIDEWNSLIKSQSGERGIVNRQAMVKQAAKNGRRDEDYEWGTNPCSEIILRPYEFCNLSEVVVRSGDSIQDLERKVRLATIIGTIQSTLTDFKYLRKIWQNNVNEERLLGVSLTGILDRENWTKQELNHLRQVAVDTNKDYAEKFGIPQSTAITCVKPSGTVSSLVDSASGIHSRHSQYYIRTVRGDVKDPLTQFMKDMGIPCEPCVMKPNDTVVFSFPFKAPETAIVRDDITAIEHLNIWKLFQDEWCEHKPSVTISVKDNEWLGVGTWVYDNFDSISGISFLPFSEHTYKQAPYTACTKEQYEAALKLIPSNINWSRLSEYETEDNTTGSQELACVAGVCEVVNIGNVA